MDEKSCVRSDVGVSRWIVLVMIFRCHAVSKVEGEMYENLRDS